MLDPAPKIVIFLCLRGFDKNRFNQLHSHQLTIDLDAVQNGYALGDLPFSKEIEGDFVESC